MKSHKTLTLQFVCPLARIGVKAWESADFVPETVGIYEYREEEDEETTLYAIPNTSPSGAFYCYNPDEVYNQNHNETEIDINDITLWVGVPGTYADYGSAAVKNLERNLGVTRREDVVAGPDTMRVSFISNDEEMEAWDFSLYPREEDE